MTSGLPAAEQIPVVILQEYIPQYRVPLFLEMTSLARDRGIALTIAAGRTTGAQGERGDQGDLPGLVEIKQREVSVFGRRVVIRDTRRLRRTARLLILEQARRNTDSYRLFLPKTPNRPVYAFWGHGRDYTRPVRAVDRALQRALTLRSGWFFAYTDGGRQAAIHDGYPADRVTVLNNSVDTAELKRQLNSLTDQQVGDFKRLYGLSDMTALFIGGLDESKRIPFLLKAGAEAYRLNQSFRLLVVGEGRDRALVESERDSPWLIYLGKSFGTEKALALSAAQVLAMPGRVGLVAVESLATGKPIVTTEYKWHAPEFEYLKDGVNAVVSIDAVNSYAQALVRTLLNGLELQKLRENCLTASEEFSVTRMAERFVDGIEQAIARTPAGNRRVGRNDA